jgi:WXG100 family type VII secretion target
MSTIKVTPQSLRDRAKELQKYNQQHNDSYKSIDSMVHNLVMEFTGEAQTAFINSFDSKKATFEQFSTEMENFAAFLNKVAGRMEQTDQDLKSQMS